MKKVIPALILFLSITLNVSAQLNRRPIDETRLHRLVGNTRSQANPSNDRGLVPDILAMPHMLLQLQRSPQQQQALDQVIDNLHNPKSPSFHRWLSASEFGRLYGAAPQDIATLTAWLQSHGFMVNSVYPSGLLIDFSGTAGQVRQTFHTEIHNLDVNGEPHIANMSDPQIPEALAPVRRRRRFVARFQPSGHDEAQGKERPAYTFSSGATSMKP